MDAEQFVSFASKLRESNPQGDCLKSLISATEDSSRSSAIRASHLSKHVCPCPALFASLNLRAKCTTSPRISCKCRDSSSFKQVKEPTQGSVPMLTERQHVCCQQRGAIAYLEQLVTDRIDNLCQQTYRRVCLVLL